jgi:hypothetical protein
MTNKQKRQPPRTRLFHTPRSLWHPATRTTLPRLPVTRDEASDAEAATLVKKRRTSKKTQRLTRGMVSDRILDDASFADWCVDLRDDPVEDADRHPIRQLLAENRDLERAVLGHMTEVKEQKEGDLRQVWQLRDEDDEAYLKAVRAEDLATYLGTVELELAY